MPLNARFRFSHRTFTSAHDISFSASAVSASAFATLPPASSARRSQYSLSVSPVSFPCSYPAANVAGTISIA